MKALYSCLLLLPCIIFGCKIDSECDERWICKEGLCQTKGIWPLDQRDIIGTIGTLFACAIAAGGGLGGGGLLVPLFMLVLQLNPHDAIPLSKATIFGNSIASLLINARKRHPNEMDRPLIDFESMMLMEPMTLAGTILGVNLNQVFPEWLITLLLVILLLATSIRTWKKGQKVYLKENKKEKERMKNIVTFWKKLPLFKKRPSYENVYHYSQKWKKYKPPALTKSSKHHASETCIEMTLLNEEISDHYNMEDEECLVQPGSKTSYGNEPTLNLEDIKNIRRQVPWYNLGILLFAWTGLFIFSLLKGGHGAASIIGVECGTMAYWNLYGIIIPFFVLVTMVLGMKTLRLHSAMHLVGFQYAEGDMIWDKRAIVRYPSLCMFAGVAAGLLGIGGGMVKGPLLLEMGVLPQVASATSATMILFTASATTIQFIVLGSLPLDYALWYGVTGFIAGLIGKIGITYLINKYRKTAIVIFLIAIVIGLSAFVMGIAGIFNMIQHGLGHFHPLCSPIVYKK